MSQPLLIETMQVFLDNLGIHVKEITCIEDTDIHTTIVAVRISGNDESLFFDNHNEVLRDLGTIFKLFVRKQHNIYKDIVVDINGRNQKLIKYTKEKAQIAVERVLFFDKPYEFGYLNSYERMIIHTYLKKFPEIESISEGVGKDRRLTLRKQQ